MSALLSKIGLPILIQFVSRALGDIDHPVARNASVALGDVENALSGGAISAEQLAEANRHLEAMAEMKAEEYEHSLTEINESLRAEILSEDKYVRRMRPTFGYLMALTWGVQMFGIAYIIVAKTESAAVVLESMASLSTIWAVGLSVLGIYVFKRSEDKKITSKDFIEDIVEQVASQIKIPKAQKIQSRQSIKFND